jgi:hypothetical protein
MLDLETLAALDRELARLTRPALSARGVGK